MREAWAGLVVALGAVAALAGSPASATVAAYADARKLPPDAQQHARYLSLYAVPEKDRPGFVKALEFHLNSLSREAEFGALGLIGNDLLRVDYRDYGWDAKTWEKLADDEPYFHVRTEHELGWYYDDKGGRYRDAAPGRAWKTTEKVKRTEAAPWLPLDAAAGLYALTGSQVPVVRADWFLVETGIERPGRASYAEFLGLGNKEQDFLDLIFADPAKSKKAKKEIAGVLARSGVALNNRRIVRLQSITGAYWVTEDFKTSVDKQNVLRFLDGDTEPPEGDASEQYGVLANGLFAYWLQNDKGVRQDVVPQTIALDSHTASNDRNIYLGIKSCASCHAPGIQPVNDYARRIFTGAVVLQSPDYDKFKRLRQLYLSDLDGQVKADNAAYAAALLKCNGLAPAANAAGYEAAWNAYAETDLTLEAAARELGTTKLQLLSALQDYTKAYGQLDTVLAGFMDKVEVPIRREHWEEIFPLAEAAMAGAKP